MSDSPQQPYGRGGQPGGYQQGSGPYQQGPPTGYHDPRGYGPPPARPRRPWYAKKRWWAAGAVVFLIVVAAVAGGGAKEDDANPNAGGQADAAADTGPEVFAIGATAHTGDFDVTVHAVQDPYTPTNQFETPPDGQRFVAVEATVANTSDQSQAFSTLVGVEMVDQLDRSWQIALAGLDLPRLDATTVAPGEARRGWVVFGVPPDATSLRVRIKGNLTATGSVFQLT